MIPLLGASQIDQATQLSHIWEDPGLSHVGSLKDGPESQSSHKFRSDVSMGFTVMILTICCVILLVSRDLGVSIGLGANFCGRSLLDGDFVFWFLFILWSYDLCGPWLSRGSPPELEAGLLVAKIYGTRTIHKFACRPFTGAILIFSVPILAYVLQNPAVQEIFKT